MALSVGSGGDPDDRLVEDKAAGRTVEGGVTETEDATVRCNPANNHPCRVWLPSPRSARPA